MSNGRPVNIRRNIDDYKDPYIQTQSPSEVTICSECRSVYHDQRWYLEEQALEKVKANRDELEYTVCPACSKIRDKMPGGIVRLSGGFLSAHREEILNLIHNEGNRAKQMNPLERVMDIESAGGGVDVLTTNVKLAQKIGKALHKAYNGEVNYIWSQDTKLARVMWQRD
ncbi:MAG: BCAM0308 family protein [Armatimonadota bacterium]|nr:BCAM0308 family protein [Armatimonadota bacterium]